MPGPVEMDHQYGTDILVGWGVSADDCHLEMGRDGLGEEGVFQMGSVAFQESIGRFLMKEE